MGKALGLMVALATAASAFAGPLDLKQVAGSAKWLAHVDFDAMRESTVVQKAVAAHKAEHKHAEAHLKMVQALTGIDVCNDLHGATLYGPEVGKHKATIILNAKLNREKLQGWAEKLPGREASEHNDHKISTWTKKHGKHSHTLATAWHGELLVLASSVDELKAALDVLDGKADSVGSDGALAGSAPAGTTVLMRATGIAEAKLPHKDPVAKQTESFRFVVGENDGKSFFRVRAEMTNDEIVGQVKEIVEGGQALATIASGKNELKLRLVNGLEVRPKGDTLTLLWSGSADDVWTQAQECAKKCAAMKAKMKQHASACKQCKQCKECDKCKKSDKCDKCDAGKDAPAKDAPSSDEEF